jgi:uncharacterized membrane protein YdbT with pleckstrin-like domain
MSQQFSNPQRQSPYALAIIFFKVLRTVITQVWPFALTIVFGKKEKMENRWLFLLIGVTALVLIRTLLNYFFFRFYVQDGQFIVKKGLFKKEQITIPLTRIQAVHLEQSFLHTLSGTYKVVMDTAGTDKAEVEIYALSGRDAMLLRELILQQEANEPITANRYNQLNGELVSELSFRDLLKLSLSVNHLETMLLILAFVFSRYQDLKPLMSKVKFLHDMESYGETLTFTWRLLAVLMVVSLLLTMVVSVFRTALKFYGYQIRKNRRGFYLQSGLIQAKQKMVPFRKIQMIRWRSNFLRRYIGLWILSLRASGDHDGKGKMVVEVPITAQEQITAITAYYQPVLPSQTGMAAIGMDKSYAWRKLLLLTLPFVLIAGIPLYFWIGWHAAWICLLFIHSYIGSLFFIRNFRCWATTLGLQYQKGIWGRQQAIVNWEQIQFITIRQTLFQRKRGLANLQVQTAGGQFELLYIDEAEARKMMNYAAYRVSSSQNSWM